MFVIWVCFLIGVDRLPPIYDPHLPTAEDFQEVLENSDIGIQIVIEYLDLLYPEDAPHDIEDAKNFA